jgi:hypothetical protein
MPTTTPGQSFPVPVEGDDPNVPDDMNNLALAIERRVFGVYNTVTDRNTRVPAPQEGQVAFIKDTNAFVYYNGTAWTDIFQQPPVFYQGTTVPSNTLGVNGDVYFRF